MLRRSLRQQRTAMSPEIREVISQDLAVAAVRALSEAETVLAFLPFGSEPPLMAALEALHREGHRILVPRCLPERRMEWTEWLPGAPMARSAFVPVMEPVGPAVDPPADAPVLVPALAVGCDGTRLGQGGGYYDGFLASRPASALHIAVVYDDELGLSAVPRDPWDASLDWALTARGLWRRRPPQAESSGERNARCPQWSLCGEEQRS